MAADPTLRFEISKIVIGEWTRVARSQISLFAKCYFLRKRLIWEMLDDEAVNNQWQKKKIEMHWDDVLSIREIQYDDTTATLDVELRTPPTLFVERARLPGPSGPSCWDKADQDFTSNQASIYRRHTLHFKPEVLREIIPKLVSRHPFWSDLINNPFPTLPSLYFEPYENSDNRRQMPSSSVNRDLPPLQSQGFGGLQVGEGRQMNSSVQSNNEHNSVNQLRESQAIPPSSQLNNEQYNRGGDLHGDGNNNNSHIKRHFWYDDGTHMGVISEDKLQEGSENLDSQ